MFDFSSIWLTACSFVHFFFFFFFLSFFDFVMCSARSFVRLFVRSFLNFPCTVFSIICLILFLRLANHEAKEDEEVTREQPVMARPTM